jgi:hypothetical protein
VFGKRHALAALPLGKSPDFIVGWVSLEPIWRVMERKKYFGFTGVPNPEISSPK